jgi:hypothetical protein
MVQLKVFFAVVLLSFSGTGCVALFSEIHAQHNHNVGEERVDELEERIDELEMWIVELKNNREKRAEEDERERKEEMDSLDLVD